MATSTMVFITGIRYMASWFMVNCCSLFIRGRKILDEVILEAAAIRIVFGFYLVLGVKLIFK